MMKLRQIENIIYKVSAFDCNPSAKLLILLIYKNQCQ